MSDSELYFSVDIEASGPMPGEYSMLSLGACRVDALEHTFYAELRPISDRFVPAALEVSGFDLHWLIERRTRTSGGYAIVSEMDYERDARSNSCVCWLQCKF